MSIFRREDPPVPAQSIPSVKPAAPAQKRPQAQQPPAKPAAPPVTVTQISKGCRIEGKIAGKSNLKVEGEVVGTIDVQSDVIVGNSGLVKGDIKARTVTVSGQVVGNIEGQTKVEILVSGKLEGDVKAARVVLAEGAFFKGNVEMTGTGS